MLQANKKFLKIRFGSYIKEPLAVSYELLVRPWGGKISFEHERSFIL
jgi:hypothetical protein